MVQLRLFGSITERLGSARAGVLHLTSSSASSQVISLGTTLLVARLYTPTDLGLLSAIASIAMLISPLVTLGLQVMIVPADTDEDAVRLAHMALASTLVGSVITAVVLALAPFSSPLLLAHRTLFCVFVPLMLLILGSFAVLSQISLRRQQYGAVAIRGIVQSSVIGLVQVGGYLLKSSFLWLFAGELLGRAVGAASLVPQALRFAGSLTLRLPRRRDVLRRYGHAFRFFLPATTLEMAAGQMIVVLTASWFGTTETGYLGLASRVLVAPVVLVGTSVGQVLATELSRRRIAGQTRQVRPQLQRLMLGLAAVGALFSAGMILLGPWAFAVVFGEEWREAGELARFISIPAAVAVVWNPISVVFPVFYRLPLFLGISAVRLALSLLTGWCLHALGYGWMVVVVGMYSGMAMAQVVGLALALRVVSQAADAESQVPSEDSDGNEAANGRA